MACDKCYTKTGYIASGFCGCTNCDKCNRCCGIPPKCDTVTIEWTVLVTGSESSPSTCCSASPFQMDEYENSSIYNQFFKSLKLFNKNLKNRRIIVNTNPLETESFNKIKFKKAKNDYKTFDFFSEIYFNNNLWVFYKKNKNYYDYLFDYNKNLNKFYWTGSDWVSIKNLNNFSFKKINCKKPFYVVFDKNLEIIKTNFEYGKLDLNSIFLKENKKYIFERNNEVEVPKKTKSEFFGIQNISSLSSGPECQCPQIGYCYSFSTTLSRSGDGCGFCLGQVPQPVCWYSIGTVGGGSLSTTQFSDQWIAGVTLVYTNLLDGYDVNVGPYSTTCGSICIGQVTAKVTSGCPLCHFNGNFRFNKNYHKELLERRNFNKKYLTKKTSKRFI